MTWIQGFNQPYPGALQILQAGGFVPRQPNPSDTREQNSCYTGVGPAIGLSPAVYGQPAAGALPNYGPPRARTPNRNWARARVKNFQGGVGAIGPAIGLSPLVYGVPFPGYPSLADQPRVGVSPAEAQQWKEVYAVQMRDRGVVGNPLPDWCPSSITTKIKGSKWCYDPKTGGWICAESSGSCDGKEDRPGLGRIVAPARPRPGRRSRGRLLRRARARRRNPGDCPQQVSPWYPTAGYGTGQYGSQYGPNQNPLAGIHRATMRKQIPRNANGCVSCGRATCCGSGMTVAECCRLVRGDVRRAGRVSRSRRRARPVSTRRIKIFCGLFPNHPWCDKIVAPPPCPPGSEQCGTLPSGKAACCPAGYRPPGGLR